MNFKVFFDDLKTGFGSIPRIFLICLFDSASKYRRTFLGPFWPILAVALGSFAIAILWGTIFQMDLRVAIPQITCGFLVWYYVSGSVVEGSSCFIDQQHMFLSQKFPLSFFPLLSLMKNTVIFIKSLIIAVIVNLVLPPQETHLIFLFPFYFLLSLSNLFLLVYVVGFIAARFRDLAILIPSVMPILFFLSPVVFKVELLGPKLAWVLFLNPLSSILICIRDPLIGATPDLKFVYTQLIMIVFFVAVLLPLFVKKHKNFGFWL